MATTKDYKYFVLEQLNLLNGITCKSMMDEYLLYYDGVLFGGIYDDRLLVKKVDSNKVNRVEVEIQAIIDHINNGIDKAESLEELSLLEAEINELEIKLDVDHDEVLKRLNVDSLNQLTNSQLVECKNNLEKVKK